MDKRTLLAIVICLAIFLVWTGWISPLIWPPPKPAPKPPASTSTPPPQPVPPAPTPTPTPAPQPVPEGQRPDYPVKPPHAVESKHLKVVFTNKGAGIRELHVRYPDDKSATSLLLPLESSPPHLALRHVGGPDAIETLPWEVVQETAEKAEYRFRLRSGVEITKEFTVEKETHRILLTVNLDNKNLPKEGQKDPPEQAVRLELLAFNSIDPDTPYRPEQYIAGVALKDGGLDARIYQAIEKAEKELAEAKRIQDTAKRDEEMKDALKAMEVSGPRKEWFGLKNRFFAALVSPGPDAQPHLDAYSFRLATPEARERAKNIPTLTASARMDEIRLTTRRAMQFTVFAGPIQMDALKDVKDAPKLVDYGGCLFFSFLVKPIAPVILWLLNLFAGIFRNYGVGIIATTILIRLCLFPLSLKSQRSAFQMQALGPKIQALRERYKDDQQKFGIEQMRLFREHKINPLSGCLPLLLQMPIFIGMYSVFELSIELRQAPFMLWMRDLSQPDQLLGGRWGVAIPLLITTLQIDAFNLLPILMTITWFLQAYFTPRSPDPQMAAQQKMMMAMPIVFGLMCYNLASGLSLYFFVNSLLGMGEQKLIKKYFLKPPEGAKPA